MINILHLRDSPWVCGPGRTVLESASHIDASQYNYIVGAFAGPDGKSSALIEAAEKRGLNTFPIREKRSIDLSIINQVCRYIDEKDIDILHSHETRSDLLALICSKKRDVKIVSTVHGWIANNIKSSLMVRLDKYLLKGFDKIIVVSTKMKDQAIACGIQEDKIEVLHNSLIIDNYTPDQQDDSFKKELALPPGTKLIANIGRLSPEKGQREVLLAAQRILNQGLKAQFTFIGTGVELSRLERTARELNIIDHVHFTGYREDMTTLYNSIDLVVQSSYTEGLPNVILESLLMKTPVIATDVGGTAEVTCGNMYGDLIPPHDHTRLSQCIENFFKAPDAFNNKASKGREFVIDNFNFNVRTSKLCKIYDQLISQQ